MIPFFAMFLFILTFLSGYAFAYYPTFAVILLGAVAISAGCLTAFLQSSELSDNEEYFDEDDY